MDTKTEKNNAERIELRSEKVRRLIGAIPSPLTRWATAVNIIIILGIVLALLLVQYPDGSGETILRHLTQFFEKP